MLIPPVYIIIREPNGWYVFLSRRLAGEIYREFVAMQGEMGLRFITMRLYPQK